MEVSKQDWKLFREKISAWQESYIKKLNHEYVKLLEGDGVPSEKFWALEKRIKIDKKHKGVLIEMRKQNMLFDIVELIRDGVIGCKDLGLLLIIHSTDVDIKTEVLTETSSELQQGQLQMSIF